MPRCPLCRSAMVTITFGLYPIAICTSCGARWIQDGRQQRAINQIQEPTLFASAQGPSAHGPQSLLARPAPNHNPHVRSHRDTGPCFLEARHGDPLSARAASP
jgi:Zn-finger nucleic acid-binding protein